jgi:uncharacterized protein YuzE
MEENVKFTHDPEADAAYLALSPIKPGEAVTQEVVPVDGGDVVLDFNRDGFLLGVEILGAEALLKPEVLVKATETEDRRFEQGTGPEGSV